MLTLSEVPLSYLRDEIGMYLLSCLKEFKFVLTTDSLAILGFLL